jgi:hypothetical protein
MKATIIVAGVLRAGYETYFEEYSLRVRHYLKSRSAPNVLARSSLRQSIQTCAGTLSRNPTTRSMRLSLRLTTSLPSMTAAIPSGPSPQENRRCSP